jgi:hypothetical protein
MNEMKLFFLLSLMCLVSDFVVVVFPVGFCAELSGSYLWVVLKNSVSVGHKGPKFDSVILRIY